MTTYFADPTVIPTPGDRGKTTRRRSTRTVRGAEGQWIAQTKEDMKSRPAGWLVKEERLYWSRIEKAWKARVFSCGRFDTEEQAQTYAATIRVGIEYLVKSNNGDNYVARVWIEREVKS